MASGISSLLLALLGVAMIGAAGMAVVWRRAEAHAAESAADVEALRAERETLAERLRREQKARAQQGEELAGLRKRAEKAKKRSARADKGAADLPLGTASRVSDLEAQVERVERERDRSRDEREQLATRIADLEAKLEVARRPAQPVIPTPAPAVSDDEPALAEARERIGKLESELSASKESEVRIRKRMANQEQLYASIRAELDVKKDRLRAQEEKIQRLEALSAAVRAD